MMVVKSGMKRQGGAVYVASLCGRERIYTPAEPILRGQRVSRAPQPEGGGSSPARRIPTEPRSSRCPQEQPELRRSSIVLFGNLTKFSEGDCDVFFEQILNGLVTLLLHLQDPKPAVVKVSGIGVFLRLGMEVPRGAGLSSAGCSLPSPCRRPASSRCACAAPAWAARGSATCSSTTCGRTGASTTASS